MKFRFTFGSIALISMLLTSCTGPGFHSAYRKSVQAYHAAEDKPKVTGPWEGYWLSGKNQHTGKLRAIAAPNAPTVPVDGAAGRYKFRYHATWAKILSGGYTSVHEVKRNPEGTFTVKGAEELALLGLYTSEGTIEGDKFESTYKADADHGVFILQRPVAE